MKSVTTAMAAMTNRARLRFEFMKNTIAAAVALLVTTAVVYAQKVSVDSDPAAPFANYKTYA